MDTIVHGRLNIVGIYIDSILNKMDAETIRKVISNLRNPVNAKARIHFTSRSTLFLVRLFEGKKIDTIDLHSLLLRLAYVSGCFRESKKYINLKDLVVYLYSQIPSCVTQQDITNVSNMFSLDHDSDYREVEDMKIIVSSINS